MAETSRERHPKKVVMAKGKFW